MKPLYKNSIQLLLVLTIQSIPVLVYDMRNWFLPFLVVNALISLVFIIKSPSCFNWITLMKHHAQVKTVRNALLFGALLGFGSEWILTPWFHQLFHTQPSFENLHQLKGNFKLLAVLLLTVGLISGFSYEMVFRGFVFERIKQSTHHTWIAFALTTVLSSIFYLSQGFAQASTAFIMSAVMGLIYINSKYNLLQNILIHAVADSLFFIAVYLNLPLQVF